MPKLFTSLLGALFLFFSNTVFACGGFFCSFLPIDQAGEQIVFRKDGDQITTMVRILYTGDAEDFGWVLPVPNTPEISLGSDTIFSELELATRPQFILARTGEACPAPEAVPFTNDGENEREAEGGNGGVIVEKRISIGAFDAQIISGDDPQAVANWLNDNNFDLTDRGSELLEPYITANMKFVVLTLSSDADAGDIQPIILKYQSEQPMIPLRLTAVAAEDDMGILTWLLSDSRAVPENFSHVVPNYTRLNWYTGSSNAYASYQTLITDAMNEAGGQGFATDYAGRFENLTENFTQATPIENLLIQLANVSNGEYLSEIWKNILDQRVVDAFSEHLPLPQGQDLSLYRDPVALATQYTAEALNDARSEIHDIVENNILIPLQNALDVLDDDLYLTRLYTTLSPEEMLTDPTFVFNPDMQGQQLDRHASLHAECTDLGTAWTLTLGEGTGRNDERVIHGRGQIPFATPNIEQDASWQIAQTFSQGEPAVTKQSQNAVAEIGAFENPQSGGGPIGGGMVAFVLLLLAIKKKKCGPIARSGC